MGLNMLELKEPYIFHVHTYRCNHAENVKDELYIKKALELGAKSITFTDHTPFPGDPFSNRMHYDQLDEYISTLRELKTQYRGKIDVLIGLEIEYLPSFRGFYEELKSNPDLEVLLLGQHHSEIRPGEYTFQRDDKTDEWKYLLEGQLLGVESGLFDAVAHPDRLFKREKKWTHEMAQASQNFLRSVQRYGIPLERNLASIKRNRQYWEEFWHLVPVGHTVIIGCDAHFVKDIEEGPRDKDKNRFVCEESSGH